MFRKPTLALGATIAIGSAALIPTSASAHMHGGHGLGHWYGGFGWGVGIAVPTLVVASDCYVTNKLVNTSVGLQLRRITVCNKESRSWTGNSPGFAKRSRGFSLWPLD